MNIKVDKLITTSKKLDEYLECLDSKNIKHRQSAIQAIAEYIKRYVTPAMYLMPNINLDDVFEKQVTGIILNVDFSSKRKNLNRPSDEELDYVLEVVIDLEPTPELRAKFWDSWLVDESFVCIVCLCGFLKDGLPYNQQLQVSPDLLRKEIEQIQDILSLKMPFVFEDWIENLIERIQEVLTRWNEEETTS